MRVEKLDLFRFRNLADQSITLSSDVTLFVGKNGQGKTSLLEAIYLLSHGKSFRRAKPSDLVRWNAKDAPQSQAQQSAGISSSVRGTITTEFGEKTISYKVVSSKRSVFINDKAVDRVSEFYGQFRAVAFTPNDLEVVKGPPGIRRAFLDQVLAMVDEQYVVNVVNYQKALKNRNSVLATMRNAGEDFLLQPWTEAIIKYGREVVEKRRKLAEALEPDVISYYSRLLDDPEKEGVSIGFKSNYLKNSELCSADELREMYRESRESEFRYRKTMIGPQRDELTLFLDTGSGDKDARDIASQGQTRSLALAMEFAAVEYVKRSTGDVPVILLDDVESELDETRKRELYRMLPTIGSQVLITATEVSDGFREAFGSSEIFEVHEGHLSPKKQG